LGRKVFDEAPFSWNARNPFLQSRVCQRLRLNGKEETLPLFATRRDALSIRFPIDKPHTMTTAEILRIRFILPSAQLKVPAVLIREPNSLL
jgi:hypothetical protein